MWIFCHIQSILYLFISIYYCFANVVTSPYFQFPLAITLNHLFGYNISIKKPLLCQSIENNDQNYLWVSFTNPIAVNLTIHLPQRSSRAHTLSKCITRQQRGAQTIIIILYFPIKRGPRPQIFTLQIAYIKSSAEPASSLACWLYNIYNTKLP